MSFVRIVTGLVWALQPVILGFAIYHEVKLQNTFIFGSSLLYMALLLVVPWLIIRHNRRLSSLIQLLLLTTVLLNGFGSFGWYWTTYHYDDVVHFLSPAIFTWGIAVWFAPKQLWRPALFTLLLSLIWEPFEYYVDLVFSTRTYGQPGQSLDTIYDLLMDSLGILFGLMVYHFTRRPVLAWLRTTA